MTSTTALVSTGSIEKDVITIVEFLDDVAKKNYNETALRKYLVDKQKLSLTKVNQAFQIHYSRSKSTKIKRAHSNSAGTERKEETSSNNPTEFPALNESRWVAWSPGKQADGERLCIELLESERLYFTVLECLKVDYCKKLSKLAYSQKIGMTHKEATNLFQHIPKFLKFHKIFYTDLKKGSNVGRLFIRLLGFFKGYVQYMKDCIPSINIMRQHISDSRFQNSLYEIRKNSRCKELDLTELFWNPLSRIEVYKNFLDEVCILADKSQKEDHIQLEKATRRIGRLATYIGKYKHEIINRFEMNRVQVYLGQQCSVIVPHRRIIRRGMVTRRTTTWPQRNKTYHLFLFNDILLWTTEQGELQNVVQLEHCTVSPSDSNISPERKFKILVDMKKNIYKSSHKHKTLLLECETKRQRNDWYGAVEDTIKAYDNATIAKSKVFDEQLMNKDDFDDNHAEGEPDLEVSREPKENGDSANVNNTQRDCDEGQEDIKDATHHKRQYSIRHRYQQSANFNGQKLNELDLDGGELEFSEYDQSSYVEQSGTYRDVDEGGFLSPRPNLPFTIYEDGNSSRRSSSTQATDDAAQMGLIKKSYLESARKREQISELTHDRTHDRKKKAIPSRASTIIRRFEQVNPGYENSSSFSLHLDDGRLDKNLAEKPHSSPTFQFRLDKIASD